MSKATTQFGTEIQTFWLEAGELYQAQRPCHVDLNAGNWFGSTWRASAGPCLVASV
jgi:hypothetical protein